MISNLPQREEFLRRKRKKRIIRYSIIFGTFIFVIALFSYISHRPSIRISKVELEGGVLVTQNDIEIETLKYNQGKYVWLFPRNNAFWYPKESLKEHLRDSFKRIDGIEMNLKNFRTLVVKISERQPIATWCKEKQDVVVLRTEVSTTSNNVVAPSESSCYFIDQNSTVFAVAPFFSGDAYFKYYGLILDENPIGLEYIASTTKFAEINQFVELVKSASLRPQYVVAKDNDEFSMVIAGGGEIYFDTKKSLTTVFDNLQALIASPDLSKNLSQLEYIDLRYGNKLFYKLK